MTSEIGRMFKCLKNKPSYHTLQDEAYAHITLQTGESTAPSSREEIEKINENPNFKSQSLDNLTTSTKGENTTQINSPTNSDSVIVIANNNADNFLTNTEQRVSSSVSQVGESSSSSSSSSKSVNNNANSSGGLLSFLGKRFNKSSTRHLDRSSSQGDSVENKSEPCNPNRYTKFPLRSAAAEHNKVIHSDPSSSSSKSSLDTLFQRSSSPQVSTAPQSNSRFDISQIQVTPQTKVYSNPNRSPSRASTRKGTFSPSNFLSKSICSFGKKSSKGPSFASKRKSKSDNNLHRVDLNSVGGNSTLLAPRSIGHHSGHTFQNSFQNIYDCEPTGELRPNSVQIGDHATIHLPWTGRNNLSTNTSIRVHQNTHNNNFDSVSYSECDFKCSSSNNFAHVRPDVTHVNLPRTEYATCSAFNKRRSKSLERDAGHRINPSNSITSSSAGTLNSSHSSADTLRCTNQSKHGKRPTHESNPNSNFGLHQVRRCLTPEEQEVLLRNISWDCFALHPNFSDTPPPRPIKPASLKAKCVPSTSSSAYHSPVVPPPKAIKPPPIGAIQRFPTPNSFNSTDSSNPPSPPPRPPSSLKPDSRLITKNTRINTRRTSQSGGIVRSNSFTEPANTPVVETPRNASSDIEDVGEDLPSVSSTEEDRPIFQQHAIVVSTDSDQSSTSSSGSQVRMSVEEAHSSGFINKPIKGWLHSDQLLSLEGVSYTVRYIGCLDVNTSMKSLDFDTRSLIAKECINQVCEAAKLKSIDRRRKVDRNVMRMLGPCPHLDHAGSDVRLTITSTCLKLTSLETGIVIATHEMPNISFASGGDTTMLDFIAYVAKDAVIGRACFILECGSGLAQDVIVTIGQAFELRFKEYIQKRPPPPRLPPTDDPEYYNDLPGKSPPEMENGKDGEKSNGDGKLVVMGKIIPTLTLPLSSEVSSVNLIDFEAPTPPAFNSQEKHLESLLLGPESPTYTTTAPPPPSTGLGLPNSPSQPNKPQGSKDPFDMQPFASDLPKPLTGPEQRKELEKQNWFHGSISRSEAERLVIKDGDFLVRESQTTPGQYVLTGLQSGSPKHLLLVDPQGIVRTKDQTFDNVTHLVNHHHSDNCLPIISAESLVILRNPVLRK